MTAQDIKHRFIKQLQDDSPDLKKIDLNSIVSDNLISPYKVVLPQSYLQKIKDEIMPAFISKNGLKTDHIVLACTHYPLILETLNRLAPWPVTYINPAPAIALRVKTLLGDNKQGTGLKHAFTTGQSSLSLEKIFAAEGFSLGKL